MIIITSVDRNASIKYSEVTGKFYISSSIWRKDEGTYITVVEHRNTIYDAIIDFYKAIQGRPIKLDCHSDMKYILPILV